MSNESKVQEKFTYGDIFRYFIPGAYALLLSGLFVWMLGTVEFFPKDPGLLASIVLLILCFIGGIFIQAISSSFLERILYKISWAGAKPYEAIFLTNSKVISAFDRNEIITCLKSSRLITDQDLSAGDAHLKQATALLYRTLINVLSQEDLREHTVATSYYHLYRGCSTVSVVGIFAGLSLIAFDSSHWLQLFCIITASTVIAFLFLIKAKSVAEKEAREPFYAFYARNKRKILEDSHII